MGVAKTFAYLNGIQTDEVEGLDELGVEASFISDKRDSETAQPVISIKELIFLGDAAKQILQWVQDGIDGVGPGILEAMTILLETTENGVTEVILDGLLDMLTYDRINDVRVVVGLLDREGLTSFDQISKNTYFNVLEAKSPAVFNLFDYVDTKYIVEKRPEDAKGELASLATTETMLIITLFQQLDTIAKDVLNLSAHGTGGITGPPTAVVYAILISFANVATFGLLLSEGVNIGIQMFLIFAPPVRRHKGINQFHLFEKTFEHLGYGFETNISEMQNVTIQPGNQTGLQSIPSGIPRLNQPGETLAQQISEALKGYDARFALIDGVAHIRSVNDPFWDKVADLNLPDVGDDNPRAINLQSERVQYDVQDFNTNRQISFARDNTNEHLAANWRGMNFLASTEPIIVDDQKNLLFTGKDSVEMSVTLAVRKDKLSEIEESLKGILTVVDSFVSFFGGNSNFAALIEDRIGAMMLSQTAFNTPIWVFHVEVDGELEIPENHRDLLSAKVLYEKYHARKSIVNTTPQLQVSSTTESSINYIDSAAPDFGNQNRNFKDFPIIFGFAQFCKLKKSSIFGTSDGEKGKIEKAEWIKGLNKGIFTYKVEEVYTRNVREFFVEPIS